MKSDLSYRKVKKVSYSGNSEPSRVLRHLYALKMLRLYQEQKHIINIDESWIPEADFIYSNWDKRSRDNRSWPEKRLSFKVNMIVAVSSLGHVWLSLTQVNTDDDVFEMYLHHLTKTFTA